MTGWFVAAYLAGALLLVMADERWHKDELAALALWPVSVPIAVTVRKWRRWRSTCKVCGGYYGTRERLLHHLELARQRGAVHEPGKSFRLPAPPPRS